MRAIAAFELRQQVRSQAFRVVLVISGLMTFGSVSAERLRIGPWREGPRNGAEAIVGAHLVWSLFFLFTATAFAAEAVLRDEAAGMAGVIRAAPVRRADHLGGRFLGALAACALLYLSVPAGLLLGALAPWLEPGSRVPFAPWPYLYGLLVLGLPNLVVACAAFFALATAARSLGAALLGAAALLVAYGLGTEGLSEAAPGVGAALAEPFGFAAHARLTAGWSLAERAVRVPWPDAVLLANRALWLVLAGALLGLAFAADGRVGRGARAGGEVGGGGPSAATDPRPRALPLPRPIPRFGRGVAVAQFAARVRLECGGVLRSPAFAALVLLGVVNAAASLWTLGAPGGPPPGAEAMAARLTQAFRLVPVTVAVFFAGDLVWNERERRLHELLAAAPVPEAAFLLPKLLAIALVLAALAAAGTATGLAVAGLRGEGFALRPFLAGFAGPGLYDWVMLATLAVALQAVSPGRLAGWGWTVLFLVASLALDGLGLTGPLYRYARVPEGAGVGEAALVRAYWAAFAMLLLVLATLLAGRGTGALLAPRIQRLPKRLRGPAGWLAAATALAFAGLGAALAMNAGA